VLPWLGDLARERPATFEGRAYVAISPVARAPHATAGGIPIGLASEGTYLGQELAEAFASVLAVPAEVAQVLDIEQWRFLTLRHLLAGDDLTFISVWSPTFLIGLMEALPALAVPLLKALREGGADLVRLRAISTALSRDPIDTQMLWPRLATISAWADGVSRGYAQQLLGAVARQIVARGEIPFLHVFTNNISAIALYERQGMEIRRRLHVTVLPKRV